MIAAVVAFFIKRRRDDKSGTNLINRGRNQSTVSTMSAEMRRQSNTTNIYGGAGPSAEGSMGISNDGMVYDFVKPEKLKTESKPQNDNVYTLEQGASNTGRYDDDDIYVVSEFKGQNPATQDDVYDVPVSILQCVTTTRN